MLKGEGAPVNDERAKCGRCRGIGTVPSGSGSAIVCPECNGWDESDEATAETIYVTPPVDSK
jgi:hypothetical protein